MSNDEYLHERFPEMTPTKSPPPLFTYHGCGFAVYGARDRDRETGTYVKTLCLTIFFIPVLALRAYRVADADRGWYFLGRVPLSGFAWGSNLAILLVVACGFGLREWSKHVTSPAYRAAKELKEADQLAATGNVRDAAQAYQRIATGHTEQADRAAERFWDLFNGPGATASLSDSLFLYSVAVQLRRRPGAPPDLLDRGLAVVEKHADKKPRDALGLLKILSPLAQAHALDGPRQKLLERIVVVEPEDLDLASQLALLYEAQKREAECEKLLLPHGTRLGGYEGARILGQLLLRKGKIDQACALLEGYVRQHLEAMQNAEKQLEAVQKMTLEQVRPGVTPDFPARQFQAADKAEKSRLIMEYLQRQARTNSALRQAYANLESELGVVPVALDLGIVRLRRAQGLADPDARKAELKQAEETFLAIRRQAGKDTAYRLYLGQVYYWLGKPKEGRKLFDDLLQAEQRSSLMLLSVSRVLREVGAASDARALAEEAYNKEKDPRRKYDAAMLRALACIDLDDQILWLRRADPEAPQVKADLDTALARKASEEGNDDEAARHLRVALAIYTAQPETTATLNNTALIHLELYKVTGKRASFDQAVALVEKSLAQKPEDAILLHNTGEILLRQGLFDVIGAALDLEALKRLPDLEVVWFLFDDAAGRQKISARLRAQAAVDKGRKYLERVLVVSPKTASAPAALFALHDFTQDVAALRDLAQRLEATDLDLSALKQQALDLYKGVKDEETLRTHRAARARQEALVNSLRRRGGPSFAVAAAALIQTQRELAVLGDKIAADDLVRLAEEAHLAAPSAAMRARLEEALFFRAVADLERQEPAFRAMARRSRRALTDGQLMCAALDHDAQVRKTALANPDVQRAMVLIKEGLDRLPGQLHEEHWVLLHHADPQVAARLTAVLGDEPHRLQRTIALKLMPFAPIAAFRTFWARRAAGPEAADTTVLKECAARGVPMPFDP